MSRNLEQHTPSIKGKSVCILGFGREGQSALRFLRQNYPELRIGIADKNPSEQVPAGVATHFGEQYTAALCEYDTIIRSPGISYYKEYLIEARAKGTHCTSATNLFFEHAPGTHIAITGTKGKSTTSALLSHLISTHVEDVRFVGNIGTPALDSLATATTSTVFVVECSSFQLEDFVHAPKISICLQMFNEHLDYHGDFKRYQLAKGSITRTQTPEDYFVCNPTWETLGPILADSSATLVPYGSPNDRAWVADGHIYLHGHDTPIIACVDLPVRGPGNIQNVLAALSAASLLDIPYSKLQEGLRSFTSLPHRLELVARKQGIRFYDDSLSTIPEATINALCALGDEVETIVLGGNDRGLRFEHLGEFLAQSSIKTMISFPTTGEKIWEACKKAGGSHIRYCPVETMTAAIALAVEHTRRGAICVLSPASSSLNMFRDYRDRSEQYRAAIAALDSEDSPNTKPS